MRIPPTDARADDGRPARRPRQLAFKFRDTLAATTRRGVLGQWLCQVGSEPVKAGTFIDGHRASDRASMAGRRIAAKRVNRRNGRGSAAGHPALDLD